MLQVLVCLVPQLHCTVALLRGASVDPGRQQGKGCSAAGCRGEPDGLRGSGLWPEMALARHSCAPNTVCLLIGGRLVLR